MTCHEQVEARLQFRWPSWETIKPTCSALLPRPVDAWRVLDNQLRSSGGADVDKCEHSQDQRMLKNVEVAAASAI